MEGAVTKQRTLQIVLRAKKEANSLENKKESGKKTFL